MTSHKNIGEEGKQTMARKINTTQREMTWEEKALSYISAKADEKKAKDIAGKLNTEIKNYLNSKKKDEDRHIDVDGTGVFLTYRSSDVWDEAGLIEYLKEQGYADKIVKTKEYVDFEALESVLYNESLPKKILKKLATFKSSVPTAVLNIKKKKGE